MNWTELIVLYLAAGAPFCVLHYFEINTARSSYVRILTSAIVLPLWIFFAIQYAVSSRSEEFVNNSSNDDDIQKTVKRLENVFAQVADSVSIYEFRETIERYVGLSIANQTVEPNTKPPDAPMREDVYFEFGVSKINNIVLARRNRRLLDFHLNDARQNLIELIAKTEVFQARGSKAMLTELFNALQDEKALGDLDKIYRFSAASNDGQKQRTIDVDLNLSKTPAFDSISAVARD